MKLRPRRTLPPIHVIDIGPNDLIAVSTEQCLTRAQAEELSGQLDDWLKDGSRTAILPPNLTITIVRRHAA